MMLARLQNAVAGFAYSTDASDAMPISSSQPIPSSQAITSTGTTFPSLFPGYPGYAIGPTIDATPEGQFRFALGRTDLPKLYANGFVNASSATDVSIMLQQGGVPVGIVTMAMPVIKALAAKLQEIVEQYEKAVGQSIPTITDLETKMKQFQDANPEGTASGIASG